MAYETKVILKMLYELLQRTESIEEAIKLVRMIAQMPKL